MGLWKGVGEKKGEGTAENAKFLAWKLLKRGKVTFSRT